MSKDKKMYDLDLILKEYAKNNIMGIDNSLVSGKAGILLYYTILKDISSDHKKMCLLIFRSICDSLPANGLMTLKEGYLGIGLVLSYAIKKMYNEEKSEVLLQNIDTLILNYQKELCINNGDKLSIVKIYSIIELLVYYSIRLRIGIVNPIIHKLFAQKAMELVEVVYDQIVNNSYGRKQSLSPSIVRPVDLYIYCLISLFKKGIYRGRIVHILDEISLVNILNLSPIHFNRLAQYHLVLEAIRCIPQLNPLWYDIAKILSENIDECQILNQEIRSGFSFKNGIPGFLLLQLLCDRNKTHRNFQKHSSIVLPWDKQDEFFILLSKGISGAYGITLLNKIIAHEILF